MFGRDKKASVGSTAAKGILFDSEMRAAALRALPPLTRLGFGILKSLARQRAHRRWNQANETLAATIALLNEYAPQIAEELGLIEPPKRRRAPKLIAVAVAGGAAYYLLEPSHGAEHRRQLQQLVSRGGQTASG